MMGTGSANYRTFSMNYKQEIISSDEYICSVNIIVAEISFYRDKKLL
jgi:hypothetical protein